MSDRSRRLAQKMRAQPVSVRYILGSVAAVDDEGCEVDLGDRTVDAIVSPLVGAVSINQGVRLSVQGNVYTVESITEGPVWLDAGATSLSGWALEYGQYRIDGAMATLALGFLRTGSDINASGTGQISDVDIVEIPGFLVPTGYPTARIPVLWQSSFCSGSGHITLSTGVVTLDDLHSDGSVDTGHWIRTVVTYPL